MPAPWKKDFKADKQPPDEREKKHKRKGKLRFKRRPGKKQLRMQDDYPEWMD